MCENPRIIFVLFYDVHKENMFTINLEDEREAPSKASNLKNWLFSTRGSLHEVLSDNGYKGIFITGGSLLQVLLDNGYKGYIFN